MAVSDLSGHRADSYGYIADLLYQTAHMEIKA